MQLISLTVMMFVDLQTARSCWLVPAWWELSSQSHWTVNDEVNAMPPKTDPILNSVQIVKLAVNVVPCKIDPWSVRAVNAIPQKLTKCQIKSIGQSMLQSMPCPPNTSDAQSCSQCYAPKTWPSFKVAVNARPPKNWLLSFRDGSIELSVTI